MLSPLTAATGQVVDRDQSAAAGKSVEALQKAAASNDHRRESQPVPAVPPKASESERKKSDPDYGYRLIAVPGRNSRVQAALDSYASLQNQAEVDEQDDVSRLLGVDYYV